MKINILVIDDELIETSDEITQPRQDTYAEAFDTLSNVSAEIEFFAKFAEDGNHAIQLLATNRFDFVFVDVMLDRNGWSKENVL